MARWLERAKEQGAGAVATLADERVLAPLRARSGLELGVAPITPNVMGLVREATEHGMLGAGLRLVRRIGLWRMARVGWRGALKAPTILLRRDFPSILSVLYDIEYAAFRAFQPKILLLHPQIADLALALGQRRVFAGFAAAARRRWGAAPGVCTHNFGWMAQRLSEWGVDIRIAMTPVNREGWRMKPDRQTCERYLRDERFCVIADLPGVGSRVSEEEIAAARAFAAVKSVAIDPFMENANR